MTSDPLAALITEAARKGVLDALAELAPAAPGPAPLVDRAGLARALCCSPSHVDKLRREPGFPVVRLLDAIRFDVAEVRRWLASRGGQ